MTICVSVKTQDGIVLGTDSMTTVVQASPDGQTIVAKTYSNARKLVQIGNLPVGVFTYGLGNLGPRSVYSHILEYSRTVTKQIGSTGWEVQSIANDLSEHMRKEYDSIFDGIEQKPDLGLHVAGFTKDSALSEEWEIEFPNAPQPALIMGEDDVGTNWEGISLPFARLFYGYDLRLFQVLQDEGVEQELLQRVFESNSLVPQVLFHAMPLQDAINYAVYVLRTTIGFTSFETGPPLCGGQLQFAVISEETQFQWVNKPSFRIPEDTNEWA